jgi:serine protease Do
LIYEFISRTKIKAMNMNWKMTALALAAVLSLTTATAQNKKNRRSQRSQSITIVRSGDRTDTTEKMTIVVDGDKVTVNGKPVEDFKDSGIRIITSDNNFRMITPGTAWSGPRGVRAPMAIAGIDGDVFSWASNGAVLGVSTEDGDGGAKVTDVSKDGAAEKAGLKVGDVITKVNDFNVADADDLPMAMKKFKPEDKVTVTYKRDGKVQTASATLQKNEHAFGNAFAMGDHDFNFNFDQGQGTRTYSYFGRPRLGLQVEDLEEGNGVKVLDVNDETPAAKAGITKDDVITSLNGKEIKSVDDVRGAMKDVKQGETVKVTYKRGGSSQTAEIKFPKAVKKASL